MYKNKISTILILLFSISILSADDVSNYHAVCVGINNYPSGWPDLDNAVSDAQEMRNALVNHQGWNENNIEVLTNGSASETSIKNALEDMPRNSSNTCLFHFAGHGDSEELGAVWNYVGIDGMVPKEGGDYRINPIELKTKFGTNYNKYCTFLDCCGSGIFPRDISKGVITSAVKVDETASDGGSLGNGLYSYYLIKGLKGSAENSSGLVTAEGLFNYAKPYATEDYTGTKYDKNPQKSDNYSGNLKLAVALSSVNISGPTRLIGHQFDRAPQYHATGTWTANTVGGSNKTYKWYKRNCSQPERKMEERGSWYLLSGETRRTLTKTFYYNYWGIDLKCVVTSNGIQKEDQIHVYITGDEPVVKNSSTPKSVVLGDNSPNPFNPTTQIKFGLPKQQKVQIDIYSITGQKIKTLVNNRMSAGYHTVNWNATEANGEKVSSGVYIYQLRCGNEVFTKKMIFAK